MHTDVLIAGGGAAGIFAAVNLAAKAPGTSILVLEKTPKLLSKVKISGGGRCNVSHACFDDRELVKNYPRGEKQLRGAFSRFSVKDTIEWFESRDVQLKTEDDGRMFPITDNSQTIINCLLDEAAKYGVNIETSSWVTKVTKANDGFTVEVNGTRTVTCKCLLLACGGHHKSEAYEWIRALGHTVIAPVPSLFTFNLQDNNITGLMGVVATTAQVKITGSKLVQQGPVLITHWGLSGPAVLKFSAWGARILHDMDYHYEVIVNWIPPHHEDGLRQVIAELRRDMASSPVFKKQPFGLPRRLWEFLCAKSGIGDNVRWADLSAKQGNLLAVNLTADKYAADGKTTFKEEFVTAGGVELSEVDFRTMESRICPGLYFAGEVLDIDGVTGGFNFQSAWTTGYLAAMSIANKLC